jgi:hypothetical protein
MQKALALAKASFFILSLIYRITDPAFHPKFEVLQTPNSWRYYKHFTKLEVFDFYTSIHILSLTYRISDPTLHS